MGAPGQDLVQNCSLYTILCSSGSFLGRPARIWSKIANFTMNRPLRENSWQLLARIWSKIAYFTVNCPVREASWELLARIWSKIVRFIINCPLRETSWQLLPGFGPKLFVLL